MADIYIVRARLRFTTMVLAFATLLSGLSTWHFWKQLEYEVDESRFLFSAVLTGALALGALGVFLFYLSANRVLNPSRKVVDRFDRTPWWAVNVFLILAVIGVAGFFVFRYGDQAENEFELLTHGKFQVLEERLEMDPELVMKTGGEGLNLLQMAYRSDRPEAVALLIKYKSPVSELDPAGQHPVVASLPNLPMLRVLLENGFDPDAIDADGVPAIHHAAIQQLAEALDLLLESGANPDSRNLLYRTALMQCVENSALPMIGKLIAGGANVDTFDQRGDTALHLAVRKRNAESIKLLLGHGANPAIYNFIHMTPVHLAAQGGYEELIPLFAEHVDTLDLVDEAGRTPLEQALDNRKYETSEVLLDLGANIDRTKADGTTLLHKAINTRDYTSARFLIRSGARTDLADKNGRTVLAICKQKELQGLVELIEGLSDIPTD